MVSLKTFLIVSGVATVILLLAPDLVTMGLFAFIIPGLIMMLVPTAFGYAALFAAVRARLRLAPGYRRNFAAAALAIGISYVVSAPWSFAERRAFQAEADVPQVLPAAPLKLAGDVLLLRERVEKARGVDDKWAPVCDALCAALLDTPGVTSVTLAEHEGAVVRLRYALQPKTQATVPTLFPHQPEKILEHRKRDFPQQPAGAASSATDRAQDSIQLRKDESDAVAAKWILRLTGDESLVMLDPVKTPDMTIAIREPKPRGTGNVAVAELEVQEGDKTVLRYRRVTGRALIAPLMLVAETTSDLHTRWKWAHSTLTAGPGDGGYDPVPELFKHTSLAAPDVSASAAGPFAIEIGKRLAAALADAARPADDAAFGLAPQWLKTRDWTALAASDLDVLNALIVDKRIVDLRNLYDGAAKHVSPALREAIATRLSSAETPPPVRYKLDDLVANMPPGTYERLLPEEDAIVSDPKLRGEAPALVMRLSDAGVSAVPRLTALLVEEVANYKREQRPVLDRLCRAFTRLGREAASALPIVEKYYAMRPSPISNTSDDASEWRVAMVRMGKPIDEVTFWSDLSPERLASERANLARIVERATEDAQRSGHK